MTTLIKDMIKDMINDNFDSGYADRVYAPQDFESGHCLEAVIAP